MLRRVVGVAETGTRLKRATKSETGTSISSRRRSRLMVVRGDGETVKTMGIRTCTGGILLCSHTQFGGEEEAERFETS